MKKHFSRTSLPTTVLTTVETTKSFHSNLHIFTNHFVITTGKNLTAKSKVTQTTCYAGSFFTKAIVMLLA